MIGHVSPEESTISSMKRTQHPLRPLLLCLLLFCGTASAEQAEGIVDQALKQRLVKALAEGNERIDRFDAEVWLVDMSQRLKGRLKQGRDEEEKLLPLLSNVYYEAERTRLSPELVLSVIQVESNFDRFAISEAGARGLMQVMPFWLKELGRPDDNLFDMQTNLRFGCTILRYYMDLEENNITRALARYNGSRGSFRYPNKVFTAMRTTWYK